MPNIIQHERLPKITDGIGLSGKGLEPKHYASMAAQIGLLLLSGYRSFEIVCYDPPIDPNVYGKRDGVENADDLLRTIQINSVWGE